MLFVIDERGRRSRVTNRVPNAEHWDIYRRAYSEHRDLVETMCQRIREAVARNLAEGREIPNSTWLGSELLKSWGYTAEWNALCGGSEDLSSALFGEIMWTVMYDDTEHDWCTLKTNNANIDREERVYFLPRLEAK